MYSGSRTDVKNIVQWLRGRDESQWEEQTKLLFETMAVLREMSLPITRRDRPDLLPPGAAGINNGMPYLRECWLRCSDIIDKTQSNLAKQRWSFFRRDEGKNSAGLRN